MNVGGSLKVCIIGPVNTDYYFGGVAIFTESLADSFQDLGYEVMIVTDFSPTKETIKNSPIISVGEKSLRKNPLMHYKLRKKIVEFSPDILISSLEYGFVNSYIKKKVSKCTTIHYLHAFPTIRRNLLDAFFLFLGSKIISRKSDFVIANSGLTSVINSEIFSTNSDCVINVGLGNDFIETLKVSNINRSHDEVHILFAGRLAKEKNVDLIIKGFNDAIKNIQGKQIFLNIVGDGPEKENLEKLVRLLNNQQIIFHGKVDPKIVTDFYMKSKVFISLNPHEPYGIVYLEALAAGCKIICPKTGGQIDTLIHFNDYVSFVNPFDCGEISNAIVASVGEQNLEFDSNKLIGEFSYLEVAKKIELFYQKNTTQNKTQLNN